MTRIFFFRPYILLRFILNDRRAGKGRPPCHLKKKTFSHPPKYKNVVCQETTTEEDKKKKKPYSNTEKGEKDKQEPFGEHKGEREIKI